MNKKIVGWSVLLLVLHFLVFPGNARAVIPPDFIFNIGTQIAQFFSIITIVFTAVFGTLFQFFRTQYYARKHRRIILTLVVLAIIILSSVSSYFYAVHEQKVAYQEWLDESTHQNAYQNDGSGNDGPIDLENPDQMTGSAGTNMDENDRLNIGGDSQEDIDLSASKFVSSIDVSDGSAKFIGEYYGNIANGNLERAYAMSKKTVDFGTFKSWYLGTNKITLDKLVRIDGKKSSIELTLYEDNNFTRYGVLMTLALQDEMPVQVEKSEVKILAQGSVENKAVIIDKKAISREYEFFSNNESKSIIATNQEFKDVTEGGKDDYIVLDARENIEYENGFFPKSEHIRFADLKAGRWIELPRDRFIYVICWSGIRGKEVAEFLRTKKIVATYLEKGANGWVEFGGKWTGSIKFVEKYTDEKYQKVFSTGEIDGMKKDGAVLIDTREPFKFQKWHIPGSISIPIMYTPTINVENVFSQVPARSKIITVCDGYVNCFDAKITGVELERRGHQFLGRYNKPWEYEK